MIKNLTFILLAFVMLSCQKSMTVIYGIKKPKVENYQSLQKYIRAKSLRIDTIVAFQNPAAISSFQEMQFGIPEALFFNSSGYYLPYQSDSIDCNAGVATFLSNLADYTEDKTDSTIHINRILEDLIYLDTQQELASIRQDQDKQYYVLIFWAKYTGRLNKVKVNEWAELIEAMKQDGTPITVHFVNADVQEIWGIDKTLLRKSF